MFRRKMVGALVLLAVAGVVGAACGGGGRASTGPAAAKFAPARGALDVGAQTDEGHAAGPTPAAVGGEFQLTGVGPRIIKTAAISIEVKHGSFEQHAQDVTLIASRHGGFIASSRTSEGKFLSGTIVVRIPAAQFEAALGELTALGKVTGEQISGQDVTAQFVDLQARLRNWEAQEDVLLKLMAKSRTIEESLKVQRALQDVQLAIEEIRGQLRVLGDQTDLSTITLAMAEKRPVPSAKKASPFVRSWRAAVHGTLAVLTAIIVGFGYMVPVLLIGLAAGVVLFIYRRARPKTVPVTVKQES
ncbi:MAG: DUF4349 domain-containing protein [Actinobacteria bacterium]|nr:MAG: DUF4349 domain-containing protein [Actinomycetota bacterium]